MLSHTHMHTYNNYDDNNQNTFHSRANDIISRANTSSEDLCTISVRPRKPRKGEKRLEGHAPPHTHTQAVNRDFQKRKCEIHRDRGLGLWPREIQFPR